MIHFIEGLVAFVNGANSAYKICMHVILSVNMKARKALNEFS